MLESMSHADLDSVAARTVELSGTSNTRDIGGYATRAGRSIRHNQVVRSDALHALSPADQHILSTLGIGTTIDLRFTMETTRAPSVYASSAFVRYVHLPLHEPYPEAQMHETTASLATYYMHLVDECGGSILAVFEALSEPQALPVIVHCTVGKDRTGVVIALLLSMLGVNNDDVVADYALTGVLAGDFLDKLRRDAMAAGMPADWCARMFASEAETMRALLAHLAARYGGAEAYLRAIGLSDARIARLHANLLA